MKREEYERRRLVVIRQITQPDAWWDLERMMVMAKIRAGKRRHGTGCDKGDEPDKNETRA